MQNVAVGLVMMDELDDEQHEQVMLTKDVCLEERMTTKMVYYNDQDKEVYEEINQLEDVVEVQHILLMINIADDYDFLKEQSPKLTERERGKVSRLNE